jgi:hypothetical protein
MRSVTLAYRDQRREASSGNAWYTIAVVYRAVMQVVIVVQFATDNNSNVTKAYNVAKDSE